MFKTTTKLWSAVMNRDPVVPFGWVHVCITWSEVWGLRYYENGLLITQQLNFEREAGVHRYKNVLIGRHIAVGNSYKKNSLQVSELMFWYDVLSEATVKNLLTLTGKAIPLTRN